MTKQTRDGKTLEITPDTNDKYPAATVIFDGRNLGSGRVGKLRTGPAIFTHKIACLDSDIGLTDEEHKTLMAEIAEAKGETEPQPDELRRERRSLVAAIHRAEDAIREHPSDPGPAYRRAAEAREALDAWDAEHPEDAARIKAAAKASREKDEARRQTAHEDLMERTGGWGN